MKRSQLSISSSVLWASAFLLGGMVLLQAGRIGDRRAEADSTMGSEGFSVVTVNNGLGGNDSSHPFQNLCVIDSRAEVLYVYYIQSATDPQGLRLRWVQSLPAMFRAARGG